MPLAPINSFHLPTGGYSPIALTSHHSCAKGTPTQYTKQRKRSKPIFTKIQIKIDPPKDGKKEIDSLQQHCEIISKN